MYRRFLNNNDYLSIITEQAMNQLIRGNEMRYEQAEQAAEATIVDYLSENYEIERELNRGKYLFEYNRKIAYPVGSHFYLDGKICEVLQAINGYKAPTPEPYWEEYEDFADIDKVQPYSQMLNYHPSDVVRFNDMVYTCLKPNGFDFGDIRIPGISVWEKANVVNWKALPYELWTVVKYDNKYFTLMNLEGYDEIVNPMESDCWGMIGEYDNSIDTYELSDHEYVVYKDEVYFPVMNPNADKPQLEVNICYNDPRNYNLKRHMVQLALYELHKLISPNNISQVRIDDYEHSLQWLKDANRLKLNPQIPRKVDKRGEELTDWQMATFQTEYDPYKNPWHV